MLPPLATVASRRRPSSSLPRDCCRSKTYEKFHAAWLFILRALIFTPRAPSVGAAPICAAPAESPTNHRLFAPPVSARP